MFRHVICPVSAERIDSNTSRLTVFINAIFMIVFLFTLQPVYLYVVTIDYTIRAFGSNRFSPICVVAALGIKAIGIKPKMIDKAPKVFASRLGLICAILGVIFFHVDMMIGSRIVVGLFTALMLLDSVVNVCVGCLIYQYLVFPFLGDEAAK